MKATESILSEDFGELSRAVEGLSVNSVEGLAKVKLEMISR